MGERNINWVLLICTPSGAQPTTQACALTRNRTGRLVLCRKMPNQRSHTSQDRSSKPVCRSVEIIQWEEQN